MDGNRVNHALRQLEFFSTFGIPVKQKDRPSDSSQNRFCSNLGEIDVVYENQSEDESHKQGGE